MRGHQPLIAMRRGGHKPAVAFIDVNASSQALPTLAQWQHTDRAPDIDIPSGESLKRTDWRPFLGLVVHLSGTDEARVREAMRGLVDAGAARVVYSLLRFVGDDEYPAWVTEWIHDTAGIMGTQEAEHG